VDSLGRYKALHYAARKFYAPVAMGLFLEGDKLTINVANETMNAFRGKVHVCFSDRDFNVSREHDAEFTIDKLSSLDVLTVDATCENKYGEFMYADLYDEAGNFIMRQTELYVVPKFFEWKKPNLTVTMKDEGDDVILEIASDTFAKGVYVDFADCDPVLSSNFFDLVNGEAYRVTIKSDRKADELEKSLQIKTVYDIGR
jgi:beta-mannosidase